MIGAGIFRSIAQFAAAAGSSLIGFIQAGAGAVARTVQDRLRETLSVRDFGAVGDGATDDTAAIQAAVNAATAGMVVVFPRTASGYKISNNINVPAGVHLRGPGKVLRTHGLAVNNYAFTLYGGNRVAGLAYDGGGLTIASPGLAQSIKDFFAINDNVEFDGNTFDNSCGSFVGFVNEQYATADTLNGFVFRGNTVGDYFDHAIYCQGYNTVPTGTVTICGNTFSAQAATTTRQAVKIKNINGATISGNAIKLPNGIFITVETGLDAPVVASDTANVSIAGNTGTCFRFFESVCAVDANNQPFMVRGLSIVGNSVTCTGYPVNLGLVPSGGQAYATRASGVMIAGNTFSAPYGININGDMVSHGVDNVSIIGNTFIIGADLTALKIWGNVTGVVFSRNTCVMNTAYSVANALWNLDNLVGVSGQSAYIASVPGVFDISDNTLLGNFGCLMAEQPASAITALNMTCMLRGNRNISSNASKREVIFQSSVIGTATGLFYIENNRAIGGTASASICANAALLTGLLKIGAGVTGLSVQPNTAGTGVALYNANVTPDNTNFALQSTGALGILNGSTGALLQVGGSTKLSASATGVTILGTLATSAGGGASTIASAGTIAPTSLVHFVSGAVPISNITPPAGILNNGGVLILIPTGAWTLAAGGNIAIASNAVVSRAMILVYDTSSGGKWYPSY